MLGFLTNFWSTRIRCFGFFVKSYNGTQNIICRMSWGKKRGDILRLGIITERQNNAS